MKLDATKRRHVAIISVELRYICYKRGKELVKIHFLPKKIVTVIESNVKELAVVLLRMTTILTYLLHGSESWRS